MFMMRITHYGYIESNDHTIRLNKEARVFAPHYIGLGRYITVERNDTQILICEDRDQGLNQLLNEARVDIKNRFDDPYLDSFFVRISIAKNDKGRFWPDWGERRQYRLSDGKEI